MSMALLVLSHLTSCTGQQQTSPSLSSSTAPSAVIQVDSDGQLLFNDGNDVTVKFRDLASSEALCDLALDLQSQLSNAARVLNIPMVNTTGLDVLSLMDCSTSRATTTATATATAVAYSALELFFNSRGQLMFSKLNLQGDNTVVALNDIATQLQLSLLRSEMQAQLRNLMGNMTAIVATTTTTSSKPSLSSSSSFAELAMDSRGRVLFRDHTTSNVQLFTIVELSMARASVELQISALSLMRMATITTTTTVTTTITTTTTTTATTTKAKTIWLVRATGYDGLGRAYSAQKSFCGYQITIEQRQQGAPGGNCCFWLKIIVDATVQEDGCCYARDGTATRGGNC